MSDEHGSGVGWPTGPPPMPPPGWYEDPEQAWQWRYWDGARWSELRSPMWVPSEPDPTSFSTWFDRSVACVKVVVRRLGLVLVAAWMIVMVFAGMFLATLWNSDQARELRRLLDIENDRFGSGSSTSLELTHAEVDRAWELVRQLLWTALPWLIVLGVLFLVVSVWSTAAIARVARLHLDDPAGVTFEQRSATVGAVARRAPATLLSSLVVGFIGSAPFLVGALVVVPLVITDSGPAAIVLTTLFVVLAASVSAVWLWGRLALAIAVAAVGGHGLGIRRSWHLTDGHFWGTVGRLIVAGLLAGIATAPASILNSFGFGVGATAFLAVWLTLQAVASAASAIVNVSAQVVLVDQLSEG